MKDKQLEHVHSRLYRCMMPLTHSLLVRPRFRVCVCVCVCVCV
jgi:hypothetical protein